MSEPPPPPPEQPRRSSDDPEAMEPSVRRQLRIKDFGKGTGERFGVFEFDSAGHESLRATFSTFVAAKHAYPDATNGDPTDRISVGRWLLVGSLVLGVIGTILFFEWVFSVLARTG